MKQKIFTEGQIVQILREGEQPGVLIQELVRRHGITDTTFYRWRKKYAGVGEAEIRRLKVLEHENRQLKQMVAEQALVIEGLKQINAKKW